MSLSMRILGIISGTAGLLLAYGMYFFVVNVYGMFNWIANYINAPESLAIVATILVVIGLLGVFVLGIIVVIALVYIGIMLLFEGE